MSSNNNYNNDDDYNNNNNTFNTPIVQHPNVHQVNTDPQSNYSTPQPNQYNVSPVNVRNINHNNGYYPNSSNSNRVSPTSMSPPPDPFLISPHEPVVSNQYIGYGSGSPSNSLHETHSPYTFNQPPPQQQYQQQQQYQPQQQQQYQPQQQQQYQPQQQQQYQPQQHQQQQQQQLDEIPDLMSLPAPVLKMWNQSDTEQYQAKFPEEHENGMNNNSRQSFNSQPSNPSQNSNTSNTLSPTSNNPTNMRGASSPNSSNRVLPGGQSGSLRALKQDKTSSSSTSQGPGSPVWNQTTLNERQTINNNNNNNNSSGNSYRSNNPAPSNTQLRGQMSPNSPVFSPNGNNNLRSTPSNVNSTTSSPMSPSQRNQSSLQQQGSFMRQSGISRFGSSVSRAFGGSITSFARHRSSFVKSWSSQYVHGRVVPPTTATTITKEDGGIPYPTRRFSKDYAPFWWLVSSFFIMFTAYSLVLNLLTSVYGTNASLCIGILYVFFVFSAMAMPSVNTIAFNNNTAKAIYIGSFGNTFMMLCAIFGWLPLLLIGAVVVGCGGGFVWVGYNSILSVIGRHIAEQDFLRDTRTRLHKRMKSKPENYDAHDAKITTLIDQLLLPNGRINLLKLTDEQTKRIIVSAVQATSWLTSIGWMLNSLNSVVGGFISWAVLSSGSNDDPVAAARPLFILFFCFGVVANFVYGRFYKITPISMFASNEQPLQIENHDPERINDNLDLVDAINDQGDVIHHSKSGMLGVDRDDGISITFGAPTTNLHTVIEDNEEDEDDEGDGVYTYNPQTRQYEDKNPNGQGKKKKSTKSGKYINGIAPQEQYQQTSPGSTSNSSGANSPSAPLRDSGTDSALQFNSDGRSTVSGFSGAGLSTPSDLGSGYTGVSINLVDGKANNNGNAIPDNSVKKPSPLTVIARSLFMMKNMCTQRVIWLSLISWYQMLFPITLAVSFFTAGAVKPTLGTENVPVIMMIVYFTDAVAALALSKFLTGFKSARWFGIIGTFIQLVFCIAILAFPFQSWIDPLEPDNKTKAWAVAISISVIGGIADALMQSGTNAALGLIVEGSMLIRSGGFGICQVCKSLGSITIFSLARMVSFHTQTIVVTVIVILSLCVQSFNFMYHLPLDQDYLVNEYNEFVKRQEAALEADLLKAAMEQQDPNDENRETSNSISNRKSKGDGTTLDDLQSIG